MIVVLRTLAVLGAVLAAAAALQGWDGLPPPQVRAGTVAFLAAGAGLVVAFVGLRAECVALFRCPDVLVPTGLAMLAIQSSQWLLSFFPSVLVDGTQIDVFGLKLAVSFWVALFVTITALQIIWTMAVLLEIAGGHRDGLLRAFDRTLRRFVPTVIALAIGVALSFACLALLIAALKLGPATLALAAVFTFFLNYYLIALPLGVLADESSFGESFATGVRLGPTAARRVLMPLLGAFLVYGVVTFANVSTRSFGHTSDSWKWSSQIVWIPTFPTKTQWYETWCEVAEVPTQAFLEFLLSWPLLAMGLVLGLGVARVVREDVGS